VENCVRLKGWSTTTSFDIVVSCSHPHNDCPSSYVHHGRSKPADWTFLSTRCSTPPGQWNEKQFDGLPYSLLSPPLCLRCIGPWLRVKKLSFILNFSPSFLSRANLISFCRVHREHFMIYYWIFVTGEATSRFCRRACVVYGCAHIRVGIVCSDTVFVRYSISQLRKINRVYMFIFF